MNCNRAATLQAARPDDHARMAHAEEHLAKPRLAREGEVALRRLLDKKDYLGAAALQAQLQERTTPAVSVAEGRSDRTAELENYRDRLGQLLGVRLLSRDDGRAWRHPDVNAQVENEVRLQLGDIHVESAVKAQGYGR